MTTCNIIIKNPNYNPSKGFYKGFRRKEFRVSCGKCPQCLAFKTQFRSELVSYQYNKVCNGVGTFLTLTYDDEHLENLISSDKDGNPILSLRKKDLVDFIKRFRRYLEYHKLYDNGFCRKDWKSVSCGEYGDRFKRPHFHLLILGIAPKVVEEVCRKEWTNGFIKALPIKDGSIRYVLKYTEKQTNTKANAMMYDDNNIERPFFKWSQGIGKDLLCNPDTVANNFQFKGRHNKKIKIPYYYQKKFYTQQSITENIRERNALINYRLGRDINHSVSFDEIVDYSIQKSNLANEDLVARYRLSGQSVYEDDIPVDTVYTRVDLSQDNLRKSVDKIELKR